MGGIATVVRAQISMRPTVYSGGLETAIDQKNCRSGITMFIRRRCIASRRLLLNSKISRDFPSVAE